ncbi:MAG: DUF6519 domain-containing protein [Desulfobulbus sp.]|nr:DUF6519 domain-containing protein [Desulfobulbus sp.]
MKTQISRNSFQADKAYSGLYLQQGRMITDADWNELTDIEKKQLIAALKDVVSCGAPKSDGLRIVADPEGSVNVLIQPGTLYAEGVAAQLSAEGNVAINGQPDYPIQADYSGQNLRLYADIWERTVTALEDESLMDPALHGADTATRMQTMLQVKWCASSGTEAIDPLDTKVNPPQGDAELRLRLALMSGAADSCDPCTSHVDVDERIGNYLFRVEVHHYDTAARILTLKWSRDNGAEACRVAEMPIGFNQGPWIWEFYDDDTERLLGNHFAANAKNLRGLLRETFTVPTGAKEPKTFVRQWDGYLSIDLKTLTNPTHIFNGMDRSVALAQGAAGSASHGRVSVSDGRISINLERMELHLDTKDKVFVAGDYWLATVRESVQVSGQYVLPAMEGLAAPVQGALPHGICHHYLLLGEIGINKRLVGQSDGFKRQMHFPPLTDIRASDVGFTGQCAGLYGTAQNLQQALDTLCAIDASDIAYKMPGCKKLQDTIKDQLAVVLDPDGDGNLSVQRALDTLLCRMRADTLPLNKLDSGLCSDLKVDQVVTVQDALKILCNKSSTGCAVVATSTAHLALLLEQFAAESKATDLWVCLRAGTYPIDKALSISGKRSLRISGQGQEAVQITFSSTKLTMEADEVILENLCFTLSTGSGQLAIRAGESRTNGCRFGRTSTSAKSPAMLSVGGQGNVGCRLSWEDNSLIASLKTISGSGAPWIDTVGTGNEKLKKDLEALSNTELLTNKAAYDAAVKKVAEQIIVLPKETRSTWKTNLEAVSSPQRAFVSMAKKAGTASMIESLTAEKSSVFEVALAVEDLVAVWVQSEPDYALRLETAKEGGLLANNEISGWLLLANGVSGYRHPEVAVVDSTLTGNAVKSGGGDLRIKDNSLEGIKANLPSGSLDTANRLTMQVSGYARLLVSGNRIEQELNSLVAATFIGQGNTWNGETEEKPLGSIIGDRGVFTGNLLDSGSESLRLTSTLRKGRVQSSGNLGVDLVSAAS